MKKLLIAALLCLSGAAMADEWVDVSSTDTKIYSIKASSVQIGKNDNDIPVVLAIGRINYLDTKKIEAYMWYVPLSHCSAKQGSLSITDVLGNFQTSVPFVFDLGTVGAQIAQTLCTVAESSGKSGKSKLNT